MREAELDPKEIAKRSFATVDFREANPLLTRALKGGHNVTVSGIYMSKKEASFWLWFASQHKANITICPTPLTVEEFLDCCEANGCRGTISL